ncbi:hypothetical protein [Larkinella punicea]|uniref:Uncharacterized protein n=1 Tax=Larkinella punicea TaxID=2315727 RepID=A0A368JUX3_9BACT|nr:hypothetical protein [Larkinella punicea]RCR71262.1 hypothetical protein DUE52_03160 [Larkinella punicea]
MSTLKILFSRYTADSGSARIAFDLIDERLKKVKVDPNYIVLGETTNIAVEPGSYLVRVQLPNGETITNQIEVELDQTKEVILVPESNSPRESLSWAYYLKRTSRINKGYDPLHPLKRTIIEKNSRSQLQPIMNLFLLNEDRLLNDDILYHTFELANSPFTLTYSPNLLFFNLYDISLSFESIQDPDQLHLLGQIIIRGLQNVKAQIVLNVFANGIPNKSILLPPFEEVKILILLDGADEAIRNETEKDPFHVMVAGNKPTAESLLSYLMNGDFQSIGKLRNEVLELAQRSLFGKREDPLGAVIGGYVLLQTMDVLGFSNWTENLYNWFPNIPDGAVIHGWTLLKQETPNLIQASELFIEAVNRGIPYYTIGLRRLYDGLNLLAAHSSLNKEPIVKEKIQKALNKLRSVVSKADWNQPVTTLIGYHETHYL